MGQKKALGRGLGALIGGAPQGGTHSFPTAPEPGERVRELSVEQIIPSPLQPRKQFRAEPAGELVDSIREHGVIQPLIVRHVAGKYELIAGERRWRAAQEVGLKAVPVIVREATDLEVLELALIENLQREDLNPMEEAQAYHRLARDFSLTQEDIAKRVGKSRAAVANSLRLLDLDASVQDWLVQGRLSVGHAKVLLGIKNNEEQRFLANQVIAENKTVRETERLVAAQLQRAVGGSAAAGKAGGSNGGGGEGGQRLSPGLSRLQNQLRTHLATDVRIQHGDKKGRLEIGYYGNDDLERILSIIGVPLDD